MTHAAPTAFRWTTAHGAGPHRRIRDAVLRATGFDLFPADGVAEEFARLRTVGDPEAERFVGATTYGPLGPDATRAFVDDALRDGVEAALADHPLEPDSAAAARELFAQFETVPEWVDPALIEEGAAVWRRWGYDLGAVGNAGTLDTYTEGSLAVPLSLSGGYAGASALHRFLETSRWWIEVSRPGALLTPGSLGRSLSMRVRIMHVSVRRGVQRHPEWDGERWGLPISQAEMLLTLLGGSVGPASGLYALGYLTSPAEIRAALHFNRYLGHLLGVRTDAIYPRTVTDGLRLLYMFDAARSHDSGSAGSELVESFVPAFAPQPGQARRDRIRARWHATVQAGHTRLFMLPWNRRRFRLPPSAAGVIYLAARFPVIAGIEAARHVSPAVDRAWQRRSVAAWERWHAWALGNEETAFQAGDLRR
ncbi:oxygenase MpaB family protein [Tsukamurella sp. 1534]|uniref:oxygenase MpaB family protein n=1 Tax=Tsukamurella sp. 1534 TaxID=1151061 RepID=UPI0002E334C8|nr:oxygenase MpaB family protein [Tsukamurella sp. 1534]